MFKKFLLVFIVAVAAVLLVACGERTYAADGVYTAFKWELHSNNGPQVTSVSVTIENDEVKSYFIDVIQNTKTETNKGTVEAPVMETTYAFNAKTKKELKYEYRMHGQRDLSEADYKAWLKTNEKLEWFEQAELIEKFFLENGPEALTVDEGKKITNVEGGVTIKDGGYSELAKEALELAKKGEAKVFVPSGNSVVFATATVDKNGKFTTLKLDTIQGKVVDGKYVWNAKTKLELGDEYNMEGVGGKYALENGEWKAVEGEKSANEWFKQSKLITDYVLENGIEGLKSIGGRGVSKDGSTLVVNGVTVKTDDYFKALNKLYNNFK